MPLITLLLADNHLLVRQPLAQYLENSGNFTILAEVQSTDEALAAIEQHQPHIALLNIEF